MSYIKYKYNSRKKARERLKRKQNDRSTEFFPVGVWGEYIEAEAKGMGKTAEKIRQYQNRVYFGVIDG